MDELEKCLKYVPTYQVIEQIRKEKKKIIRKAVKTTKEMLKNEWAEKEALIHTLLKNISIESITKILNVVLSTQIEKVISNKNIVVSTYGK